MVEETKEETTKATPAVDTPKSTEPTAQGTDAEKNRKYNDTSKKHPAGCFLLFKK